MKDLENIQRGPDISLEVPNITLGQFVFGKLKSHNPYDVLLCEAESGKTVSSTELLGLSMRVAESLKETGLTFGDVVCIMGKAGIDAYSAATGTLFGGGIVFPVDVGLDADVLRILLKATEPKYVFCDADIAEEVSDVLSQIKNNARVVLMNSNYETQSSIDIFEDFIKIAVDVGKFQPKSHDDAANLPAFLVCSSGTMGIPKPVMLTNKNLLYQIGVWSFLGSLNKILSCPAIGFSFFFWVSGVILYLMSVCMGFELTVCQKLEPAHILRVIERHKPVWGMFSPALLKYLTHHPEFKSYNVSSLAYMVTGGCSLEKSLVEKVRELWSNHVICRQSYGLTEVSGSATYSRTEDDILSVGRLLPAFQMKVVNMFDGSTQGPGQRGEIYLSSPTVMKGYMKNEDATKNVMDGEWFKTGDVGYYTEDGLIYITGRIKDFIRFKEHLISPVELEEIIMMIPGVLDVGIVGIALDNDNAVPMALVVKAKTSVLTEDEIAKHVKDIVEEYKQLRGGVHFVEGIPRTPSGKMKRAVLLNMAKALYTEE